MELLFLAVPSSSLQPHLVERITNDAKGKPEGCRKLIQPTQGMRIRQQSMARRVFDDVLQHTPYPTPITPESGGASVLIRSKRRQPKEPGGAPYLANPPASADNEGSSTSFQEVWMYASSS